MDKVTLKGMYKGGRVRRMSKGDGYAESVC